LIDLVEAMNGNWKESHRLAEFDQNAVTGFGMQEGDQFVIGAAFGFFVERDKTFSFQPFHFGVNI
jgi:hypothetical protein